MSESKDDIIQKRYFLISEVAEIITVPTSTIRFWLHKFYPTISDLRGNRKGKGTCNNIRVPRAFIDNLKVIYVLRFTELYSLKGVERQLNKMSKEDKEKWINEFNKMQ